MQPSLIALVGALGLLPSTVRSTLPLKARQNQQGITNTSNVTWIDCEEAVPAPLIQANVTLPNTLPKELRCGAVDVPLDWDKPLADDNKISVGFALHAAPKQPKDSSHKAPVLNYNPGGPALETTSFAWARALGAPEGVIFTGLEKFDLLAIDVRGTFRSTSLNCTADTRPIPAAVPTTEEGYNALVQLGRHIGETCRNSSSHPDLATHAGSEEVAKDWNAVRQALSFAKLYIWGYSYGTFDAQIYANMFPDATARVVLDGVYSPGTSNLDLTRTQTKALTRVIDRADAYCQSNTSCPFNSAGKGSVQQAFQQVLIAAGRGDSSGVTSADVSAVTYNAYFNTHPQYDLWFLSLGGALQGIWDGFHYDLIAAPLSAYTPTVLPIACRDIAVEDRSFDGWQKLTAQVFDNSTDKYGVHWAQDILLLGLCAGWPFDVKPNKAYPAAGDKSKDILILNSDYDLNTPIEGALAAWKNLPQSTVVIRHGDGHGTMMANGPARDAAIHFLVKGDAPKANSTAQYTVLVPPVSDDYKLPDAYSVPIDGQTSGAAVNGEGIPPAGANSGDENEAGTGGGSRLRAGDMSMMYTLGLALSAVSALYASLT